MHGMLVQIESCKAKHGEMQVCNDDRSLHGAQIKIDATEREAE
jgi:hypothetical protein